MDSTSKSEQVGDLFRFRSSTGSSLIPVKDILEEFEDLAVELRHHLSDRSSQRWRPLRRSSCFAVSYGLFPTAKTGNILMFMPPLLKTQISQTQQKLRKTRPESEELSLTPL